jgi:NCAIR mutase (PurE)-related protein
MDSLALRSLLDDVRTGRCHPDDAVRRLRRLPFADLGFARVDHHRPVRQGIAEAVYGPGKTPEQCAAIVAELLAADGRDTDAATGDGDGATGDTDAATGDGDGAGGGADANGRGADGGARRTDAAGAVILTRADAAQVDAALAACPDGRVTWSGHHATVCWRPSTPRPGRVLVVTAGTADLPVADECAAVLTAVGLPPRRLADCGVAGVHRLLASQDELLDADVIVVVAGMEGALASVVGGIAAAPVVAVPTSVGYGASLDGVTALLAMLASCAAGVAVVGIDNGFGAACAAARMLTVVHAPR